MSKSLWVTWERHRRSKELAAEFEADYYPLVYEAKRPLRYFVLSVRTVFLLVKTKPKLVFCQNPSIVLTTLLVLLKSFFCYRLIVDRHSNFKLEHKESSLLKWKVFHFLSEYTIRHADLTIVTNNRLKSICNDSGGSAAVLQDKIPCLTESIKRSPPLFMKKLEKLQVMFVTMFDEDEPIEEMIDAAGLLPNVMFYFTGNYNKKISLSDTENLSDNIILTGFVSDKEYLALMENCSLVVVLTKKDLILNCGAYEAISLNKPLILSDTPTLKSYFKGCALYSKNSKEDIANNIEYALLNCDRLVLEENKEKRKLQESWQVSFENLMLQVAGKSN